MSLQPLVEKLVDLAVDHHDQVSIKEVDDRGSTVFMVTVAQEDVGRVIGKDGRVITCIRQVVSAAGAKARQRVYVKVDSD